MIKNALNASQKIPLYMKTWFSEVQNTVFYHIAVAMNDNTINDGRTGGLMAVQLSADWWL